MSPFRFIFITQEDPFYVRVFFEEFLKECPDRGTIAAVAIAPAMGKKSAIDLARQMLGFYGLFDFARVGLRYVAYRAGAAVGMGGRPGRFLSLAQVCRYYGVEVIRPQDLNSTDFLEQVRAIGVQLVVSVAAPQIFGASLLELPPLGCINIHNSRLPKYRGMLPNFWQMYHGERSVGTTVHRVNAKLDDGAILLQSETPIEHGDTLHDLIVKTKRSGAHLMLRAIEQLRTGTTQEMRNSGEEATYFSFPTSEDVRVFKRRGLRLI